jgi:hypothetical protein
VRYDIPRGLQSTVILVSIHKRYETKMESTYLARHCAIAECVMLLGILRFLFLAMQVNVDNWIAK